jgi:hypothetical protein
MSVVLNRFVWLVVVCLGIASAAFAENAAHVASDKVQVSYFDFDIQRLTGIPESEMWDYGCHYLVDRQPVLDLLGHAVVASAEVYEAKDIRAEIHLQHNHAVFISRTGIARDGQKYLTIDKLAFAALLAPIKPFACHSSRS